MNFDEFVTDDRIIALLCREKCKRIRHSNKAESQRIDEELKNIMPTRRQWLKANKSKRFIHNPDSAIKQRISRSSLQLKSLHYTVRKHRRSSPDRPYIINLNNYIARIKEICSGAKEFSFSKPDIIPLLKKEKDKEMIYRPISLYKSLDDKVMLNLTNQYLSHLFDECFHEDIISYRIKRIYKGEKKITTQHDAIKTIKKYLHENRDKEIFVAECDITKFFDILNHKIIKREFEKLLTRFKDINAGPIRRLFYSYIDSYSYFTDVYTRNDDKDFWNRYRVSLSKMWKTRCFEWVQPESFFDNNIYNEEEWNDERIQIGTPQGGALSLLVSNIVMNAVDQAVVLKDDPGRLFIRYGDDVIMMHTNRKDCEKTMDTYVKSLLSHKLLFHPFKPVSDFKKDEKVLKEYWDNKSKSVFRWGKGDGDSANWIGFVGYEISRNGDVRIRKSTFTGQFSRINKAYHRLRRLKNPDQRSVLRFGELVAEGLDFNNFETVSSRLFTDTFRELNKNIYSVTQIKALDRYRNKKFWKLRKQVRKAGLDHHFYIGKPFSYYYHFIKNQCVPQ